MKKIKKIEFPSQKNTNTNIDRDSKQIKDETTVKLN